MDRAEWGDAALVGETLVQIDPGSALAWRLLGEAQAGAGNRPRAVESLRETLRLSPRAQVARMMLRRLGEAP
jgi:cytochrome c-type biogenesis protein CcmH/NrfG